ncbi:heat shock protein HtpX [Streptococcus pneumoniae]|nr:heat shock protein HtpX [Streptococcus pneumoniae]
MLFDQIASNKRKTWILLLVFFLLLALVGYAVGYLFIRSGLGGLVIACNLIKQHLSHLNR